MKKITEVLGGSAVDKYRPIPFWSWNDKLTPEELKKQICWMKKQGFGGFFMHARAGLLTEYLSDDWFECISASVDEGKKEGLTCWAYDENGWPSGFVGGKLLEDPDNCDRFLSYNTGEFDPEALVSYLITEDKIIRASEGGKGEYLNVYEHISVSTADILNGEVVDKFLNLTHEQYLKRLGGEFGKLEGFFTDEPQYYRAKHAYTRVLPAYFKEQYEEDVLDSLGLMFVEKEGYRAFRYKYWKSMQALMLKNFAEKVYSWCDGHGVKLTGHYVEETRLEYQNVCCGGVMPFYEFEHIPGVDHLGRKPSAPAAPKQVSSVAAQLGKKQVLTETFGCGGWGITPRELKINAESQFVNGVNLMCQHLLPYSERGQRKRDYPAHFSWVNPWVRKDFKSFNDYFARLGYLLGESTEEVKTAVFCPMRSMYFYFKRAEFEAGTNKACKEIEISYQNLVKKLSAMQLPYHIADETVMEKHAAVKDGKLIIGQCAYTYLIFPKTVTMDRATKKLVDAFIAQGGKILFTDGVPEYLEGEPCNYGYSSNIGLDEIVADGEYCVDDNCTAVQSVMREIGGRKFIFAVNLDNKKDYTLTFSGNFSSFVRLDLETLETQKMSTRVHFHPGESFVLFLSNERAEPANELPEFTFKAPYKVVRSSGNYMLLDKLSYSLDGVNYSEPLRYMGVFNELLEKRHNGAVYLKYEFTADYVPDNISFLAEDMHNEYCEVNGHRVVFGGYSDFERAVLRADISGYVKKGKNSVIIKINFYESDRVYYVLFGENVTESLKNCLAYDTTIEACYLQGDFGVYSRKDFIPGKTDNILIGEDFYIGEPKAFVTDLIKDGYPFFAGDITLKTSFISDGNPAVLKLSGNYCLCDLVINGKKVKKSYFADMADVTGYLKQGENLAEITLYSGNRNLLGPLHFKETEEPTGVGPYTFELPGTWKNGISSEERNNYAFVRFGLFDN